MANEPGSAILALFASLVDRVKQRIPVRTDGKPLGSMVYSQLVLGMPILPDDYKQPWSPSGGASLRQALPAAAPVPAGGATPAPLPDREQQRALQAAWKTAILCRTMLKVVKGETYEEYPTGRHLDFAYETVLRGMQPGAAPVIAPDVAERVAKAKKFLYKLDEDGSVIGKRAVYENYLKNARALAAAKSDYATAFATAKLDPAKFEVWPQQSAVHQQAVDAAFDSLHTESGDEVQAALDVINSVGVPMQEHMIARARKEYDAWNLGLAGVPANVPYSLILPTHWCDPTVHDGFERLQVTESEYKHYNSFNASSGSQFSWQNQAQSNSGSAGISFGFLAFGGSHSDSTASGSWQNSSGSSFQNRFSNSAKSLTIDMEYGLCTIHRPWLISDLFFLKNWYLKGAKKNTVSDGTIGGQVDNQNNTLPMVPQQFLVVRNVRIHSSDWGDDGGSLSQTFGAAQGSTESGSSSTSGGGGVCLGFVNFGGGGSHSESHASGQGSSWEARSGSGYYGTTFKENTLTIPGAQIVGFLSDIVPGCPDLDDPTLA